MNIKQGDILYADLGNVLGCEQGGVRPVVIAQNDIGNKYSPTTIVIPITSKVKNNIPTHVDLHKDEIAGLDADSTVLCEQLRTIDKKRLKNKIAHLNQNTMNAVLLACKISLNMF